MISVLMLETDRLILRPFERSDREAVLSYYCLPCLQRYLDWKAHDDTQVTAALDAMRKQVGLTRPGDVLTFAIARRSDHRAIGHVALNWTDATAAQGEIRFALAPAYQHNGYASEALGALLAYGFDTQRLHRIFARVAGQNDAAAKLLRSLGMRLEAHYREHALFRGEWDEELHFAILDREWQRREGSHVRMHVCLNSRPT